MNGVSWCFIHEGKKYAFSTKPRAEAEAFRLTGKIGAVGIYQYKPLNRSTARDRYKFSLLLGVAVATAVLGTFTFTDVANWLIRMFGAGVMLLIAGTAVWVGLWIIDKMYPVEKKS